MSVTIRQNKLLVAEDWKKVYQSFKNADFQSYDFENLRRTMIDYIRINYPEDFNDYIESSEYLALIDLIAFLGQSIAFRVDLNARDNFLELSERRESVLRLARMISYNAKRNLSSQGLLKFTTVSTSENVIDSNGRNLSDQVVSWNDPANPNWYDQFIKVMNAAFPQSQQYGNPADKATIYSIPTEQYRFNSNTNGVPVFVFTKSISGRIMNFEITSTTFKDQGYVYEEAPKIGNKLACIFKDDGRGFGSTDSGFFLNFVQGTLNQGLFTISQPSSNESIDINANNINNNDVWLYRLDSNGLEAEYWTPVSNLEGNNIIYNSLSKSIRNIYSTITRAGDMISLQFSDGTFGNLPLGTFRSYYRISNGLEYVINPQDIRSVAITIPYTSATNQLETLTVTLGLTSTVANATATESNDSIKANAPANYYTQNRMISGEDYNISPLTVSTQVVKVKSVNRTSTGISRYFDLIDPTGKYSSTRLFADDGILYTDEYVPQVRFSYQTKTDIEGIIYNSIFNILQKDNLRDFYYSKFIKFITTSLVTRWISVTSDFNASSGYIDNTATQIYKVGSYTSTDLKYFSFGALVKFVAPTGYYFNTFDSNKLTVGTVSSLGSSNSIWAEVVAVTGNGTAAETGILDTGFGPIGLNIPVPTNAIISQIIPAWRKVIDSATIAVMIDLIFSSKPFGLRYDAVTQVWKIITEANLNGTSGFNLSNQGDVSNQQRDASWLLLFTTDNEFYTVSSREQRYIFESDKELQFYNDNVNKIYDSKSNSIIKDVIKVLSINTIPNGTTTLTLDQSWEIISEYVGLDGYVDNKKAVVTFSDSDDNGIVDNPELFLNIVAPTIQRLATGIFNENTIQVTDVSGIIVGMYVTGSGIGSHARVTVILDTTITLSSMNTNDLLSNLLEFSWTTYITEVKYAISAGQEDYKYISNLDEKVIILKTQSLVGSLNKYVDGQYFYFTDTNVVKQLFLSSATLEPSLDYKVYVGRDNLKFQYDHSADYESRIDPGTSNIIDVFVLSKGYDINFRQWISNSITTKPLPPGSDELYDIIAPGLNLIKSISDEIVYHPVSYKILFGSTAPLDLQASFKVVKNSAQVVSDNDIKSRIITAMNQFFALENWDFGDTFYFTELATYITTQLAPDISNFVIVPRQGGLSFGSLFEIQCPSDQIFINGATVDDIDIVAGLTSSLIKAIAGTTAATTVDSQQLITSSIYGVTNV
jgi:hypothetical protein